MSIGIDFILRAKTNLFTNGLANANNGIDSLKKSLKSFDVGNGLKQALGVGGVIEGFRAAINTAQELRDSLKEAGKPISDSIRSVAEYGDALDLLKTKIGEVAIGTLGFFTQAGEGFGMLINRIRGVSLESEMAGEQAQKDADAQVKKRDELIKKSREREKTVDRDIAEQKKSREREKTVDRDIAEQTKKNQMDALEGEKKLIALVMQRQKLEREIGAMAEGVAKKEKQLESAKLKGEINTIGRDLSKEEQAKQEKEAKEKAESKKALIEKFAPTVEQLAEKNAGGFFDPNSATIRAKQALALEDKSRGLFDRGDFKGGLEAAQKAAGIRKGLEGQSSATGVLTPKAAEEAVSKALEATNGKLDVLTTAVSGIIKAQK